MRIIVSKTTQNEPKTVWNSFQVVWRHDIQNILHFTLKWNFMKIWTQSDYLHHILSIHKEFQPYTSPLYTEMKNKQQNGRYKALSIKGWRFGRYPTEKWRLLRRVSSSTKRIGPNKKIQTDPSSLISKSTFVNKHGGCYNFCFWHVISLLRFDLCLIY